MMFNLFIKTCLQTPVSYKVDCSSALRNQMERLLFSSLGFNKKTELSKISVNLKNSDQINSPMGLKNNVFSCKLEDRERKRMFFDIDPKVLEMNPMKLQNREEFERLFAREVWSKIISETNLGSLEVMNQKIVFKPLILYNGSLFIVAHKKDRGLLENIDLSWLHKLIEQLKIPQVIEIKLFSSLIGIRSTTRTFDQPQKIYAEYRIYLDKDFWQKIKRENSINNVNIIRDLINPEVNTWQNFPGIGSLQIDGKTIIFKSHVVKEKDPIVIFDGYMGVKNEKNILLFVEGLYRALQDKPMTIIVRENEILLFYNFRQRQNDILSFKNFSLSEIDEMREIDWTQCQQIRIQKMFENEGNKNLVLDNRRSIILEFHMQNQQNDMFQQAILCGVTFRKNSNQKTVIIAKKNIIACFLLPFLVLCFLLLKNIRFFTLKNVTQLERDYDTLAITYQNKQPDITTTVMANITNNITANILKNLTENITSNITENMTFIWWLATSLKGLLFLVV